MSVSIAAVGMVTAVGLDAPSACAAMRAKLDAFQETRFLGPQGGWVIGAPVPLKRLWLGESRIAHLAAGAIVEALDQAPFLCERLRFILCLGESGRPGHPVSDPRSLLRRIAEITEQPHLAKARIIAHGRPSGHVAFDEARRMLAEDSQVPVLVVGVDSYLTSKSIRHYIAANRILAPRSPNGFIPGEAAAAVLMCKGGGNSLHLTGVGLSRERAHIYNGEDTPLRGDGMTAAYRLALQQSRLELRNIAYRMSDLIGEQHWFKQASLASLRLVRGPAIFQDLRTPTESLGNIGAAVVPMMVGMAWFAARKGYAQKGPVLIEASNDDGACGAAIFATAG